MTLCPSCNRQMAPSSEPGVREACPDADCGYRVPVQTDAIQSAIAAARAAIEASRPKKGPKP